jgi:hypothetical protein
VAARLRLRLEQAEAIAGQIRALASGGYAPLAELPGVDLLTAGALAAASSRGTATSTRSFAARTDLSGRGGAARCRLAATSWPRTSVRCSSLLNRSSGRFRPPPHRLQPPRRAPRASPRRTVSSPANNRG